MANFSSTRDEDVVIDRISNLPDCILSYILSLMPTKYAVRTSILSTRWKFIWTYIINLDFDDDKNEMFRDFVYRVLRLLKQQKMHKFRLYCKESDSNTFFHINNWVFTAIERGVEELDLTICDLDLTIPCLPSTLFECKTLRVLKLCGLWNLSLSKNSINLPSLKILHVFCNGSEDQDFVLTLVSSCPVLQELKIFFLIRDTIPTFNISSTSLTRLKVHLHDNDSIQSVLQLNTPALKYLSLEDGISSKISLINMGSLVEAYVDACICKSPEDDDYDNILLQLFNGLSNTKYLSLSSRTMKALSLASDKLALPKFGNLLELTVYVKDQSCELKPLASLCANSIILEEEVIYD